MKRWLALALAAALLLALLAACGGGEDTENTGEEDQGESLSLTVCATPRQTTVDPAAAAQSGGETILYHLYENLLRWTDDGSGHAVLAPGAAESYTEEESVTGQVTYTFTLRAGAVWSDGEPVTAYDFLYAWQRLFTLEETPPLLAELSVVEGCAAALEAKDGSLLTGVSAPDKETLVITLTSHCAYFLDEFCAGALTMPVRRDVEEDYGAIWGQLPTAVVTNGPYRLKSLSESAITLQRSESYRESGGPDQLTFVWMEDAAEDYGKLAAGELQFLAGLPGDAVAQQAAEGTLRVEEVPSTYALLMNNRAEPFDNEFVRQAFAAVVDPQAVTEAVGLATLRAATGFVPWGVANRDDQWAVEEETAEDAAQADAPVLPEDLVEQENSGEAPEEETVWWDYRAVGDYGRVQEELSYDSRVNQGRALLSQAGYPNGRGFPAVEYVFVDTPVNTAVAIYLQDLWASALNVEVTLRGVSEEEMETLLLSGEVALGAFRFDAAYDDAMAFLRRWQSEFIASGENVIGFNDRAYDLLLSVVSASGNSAREACLHDAEELLLDGKGVVPLFYYGATSQLADGLTGVYRRCMGEFFFTGVTRTAEGQE